MMGRGSTRRAASSVMVQAGWDCAALASSIFSGSRSRFHVRLLHLAHAIGGCPSLASHTQPHSGRSHFHADTVSLLMFPMVAEVRTMVANHCEDGSNEDRRHAPKEL